MRPAASRHQDPASRAPSRPGPCATSRPGARRPRETRGPGRRALARTIGALVLAALPAPAATTSATGEPLADTLVLPAPADEVWDAFATADGLRSWWAPAAWVELHPGGTIETGPDASAPRGAPGHTVLEILSLSPGRMLSWRRLLPAGGPAVPEAERPWTVLELEPLPGGRTRLVLAEHGDGGGPGAERRRTSARRARARLIRRLRARFPETPAPADEVTPFLAELVGTWTFREELDDDDLLVVTLRIERAAGRYFVARGLSGGEEGLAAHTLVVYGPLQGVPTAWEFPAAGEVLRSRVRREGDRLVLEGRREDGTPTVRQEIRRESRDHLRLSAWELPPDGEPIALSSVRFTREPPPATGR